MTGNPKLRSVRLRPEWQTGPLWTTTDQDRFSDNNATPESMSEEFAVSPRLAREIAEWDGEFQQIFNPDDPLSSEFQDDATEQRWRERGRQLAERLAQELGPHVRVTYFKEVVQQGEQLGPPLKEAQTAWRPPAHDPNHRG